MDKKSKKSIILTIIGVAIIGTVLLSGCVKLDLEPQISDAVICSNITTNLTLTQPDLNTISHTFYEDDPIYVCANITTFINESVLKIKILNLSNYEGKDLSNAPVITSLNWEKEVVNGWYCYNLSNKLKAGKYAVRVILGENKKDIPLRVLAKQTQTSSSVVEANNRFAFDLYSKLKENLTLTQPDLNTISHTFYEDDPIYVCANITTFINESVLKIKILNLSNYEGKNLSNAPIITSLNWEKEVVNGWYCYNLSNKLKAGKYAVRVILGKNEKDIPLRVLAKQTQTSSLEPQISDAVICSNITTNLTLTQPDLNTISHTFYEDDPIYVCANITTFINESVLKIRVLNLSNYEGKNLSNAPIITSLNWEKEVVNGWYCYNLSNKLKAGKYAVRVILGKNEKDIPLRVLAKQTQTSSSVVEANNRFAFDLYSELNKDPKYKDSNIFYSPYSISTALAMAYEGARGKTADEMKNVLHLPDDKEKMHSDFMYLNKELNKKTNNSYNLSTANALWAQKDFKFLDEYFKTIEQYYDGKATNLDFVRETEKSRQIINEWVENQTNNKIKDLIPKGKIDKLTRLVITNAIYFKGIWKWEFNKSNTREMNFVTPTNKVKVQMMYMEPNKARFNYTETDKLQILELPYKGDKISMFILLPKQNYTLKDIEKNLTYKDFENLKKQMHETKLDEIYIPKFKLETKYFMKKILMKMGMPTAFSENADFSGMDGNKDLFISHVIHQAYVNVSEEGTEAAAATAVIIKATAAPGSSPKIFKADHPYVFIIQDKETGDILFIGRVTNPTKS